MEKDELFEEDPLAHAVFRVSRLGLGYAFDLARTGHGALGLGGLVSFVGLPESLRPSYGGRPVSFVLFARAGVR